jgi:LEA14-like dessication related protein
MCLFIFGVGCSALNVQKPTAMITNMAVQNVDANSFTMNFSVDVTNPNKVELPLTTADYKIGLSGVKVADGTVKPGGSIAAGEKKSISLPVTLTYENLLSAEQAIVAGGGNVPYTLDGDLVFNSGLPLIGDVRVPVQSTGTLALKAIVSNPQAILQNAAAAKLAKELIGSFFGH